MPYIGPDYRLFGSISTSLYDYKKSRDIFDVLSCIASLVKVLNRFYLFRRFQAKKNTQRQPKIIFLVAWKLLKIENSGATKTNKRNLPDICTTWTAFNNRKLRVLIERWQGVHPNTHRKCLEFNSILTLRPFSISCKITIKVEIK